MKDSAAFPYFTIPEKGETVYSLFCRFAERSGISATQILGAFLGHYRNSISSALPRYVQPIASKLPIGHPWRDAELIVTGHTTLPYFLYFRPPEIRAQWITKFAEHRSAYHLLSGIGLAAFPCPPSPTHPRFCLKCREEDMQNLGFSYFRREHQLPGVAVCWVHGEMLYHGCTACGPYPLKRNTLRMAGRCGCEEEMQPLPSISDPPADLEPLCWLARESAYIVRSSGMPCGSFRNILKKKAFKEGFEYKHGIDHAEFARAIESRFHREVLQLLGISPWRGDQPAPWVKTLMYSLGADRKPTIHRLLAIGTLFGSVADFELAGKESGTDREEGITVGFQARTPEWAGHLPELVRTSHGNLSGMARSLGISIKKLAFEIRHQCLRVPLSLRTLAKLGGRKLTAVRKDLRDGIGRSEICSRHGCSEWEVLMIELDDPSLHGINRQSRRNRIRDKHRRTLLAFLARHPDAGRIDIFRRPALRAARSYLIKYDKEWISSELPAPRRRGPPKGPRATRIDWVSIDRLKAEELERTFNDMLSDGGEPVWLSKNGMLRIVGLKDQYHRYQRRLPLVGEVLRQRAEAKQQYVIRRLKWAVKKLAEAKEKLSLNNILRIINIKHKTVHEHAGLLIETAREFEVEIDGQSIFTSDYSAKKRL